MVKLTIRFLFLLCFISSFVSFALGQELDTTALNNWPRLDDHDLSPDGKYVTYITNIGRSHNTFFIKKISGTWLKEFKDVDGAVFTDDSKYVIFKSGNDLILLNLSDDHLTRIPKVKSFKVGGENNNCWVAYLMNGADGELMVKEFTTGKSRSFNNIITYDSNEKGTHLALKSITGLRILELPSLSSFQILSGKDIRNVIFDNSGEQLAVTSRNNLGKNFISYFKLDESEDPITISDETQGMSGLSLTNSSPVFSKSGQTLFFYVRDLTDLKTNEKLSKSSSVVWNSINSGNVNGFEPLDSYLASVSLSDLSSITVHRLQFQGDYWQTFPRAGDNIVFWRATNAAEKEFYLVKPDASRTFITSQRSLSLILSPEGKYLSWFDDSKLSWFTFRIKDNKYIEISHSIAEPMYTFNDGIEQFPEGILGWLPDDSSICIYGRDNIWLVDPDGKRKAINITRGFFNRTGIILKNVFGSYRNNRIEKLDSLILMGYNPVSKEKGFFRVRKMNSLKYEIQKLSFGPVANIFPARQSLTKIGISGLKFPSLPRKAKYAEVYILKRDDANHFPNIYSTTDFKNLQPLTDIQPQSKYRWYTNELFTWKTGKNESAQGIIFKPQDFNSRRKYPVIFYFYEKSSDAFNLYIQPELSSGQMNIPWMVSRGYVVVTLDIHFKLGAIGKSYYDYVVSAAKHIMKMNWVDAKHMGMQGHSFAAFGINYIVTHSKLFAAAAPGAAVSNTISDYNGVRGNPDDHLTNQSFYEEGQGRMNATLWQNKQRYISESPILNADKVTTPILLMHNPNDASVGFGQALEWYNAMVRLRKPLWLVIYKDEDHSISSKKNKLDYTNKLTEFFDHYLKGAPMPEWMK